MVTRKRNNETQQLDESSSKYELPHPSTALRGTMSDSLGREHHSSHGTSQPNPPAENEMKKESEEREGGIRNNEIKVNKKQERKETQEKATA